MREDCAVSRVLRSRLSGRRHCSASIAVQRMRCNRHGRDSSLARANSSCPRLFHSYSVLSCDQVQGRWDDADVVRQTSCLHPFTVFWESIKFTPVHSMMLSSQLASTANITSGLQLGRAEVLRGLRNFLNMDRPEHLSIDRLKERGAEKGSGRHSTLKGRERSVFYQKNIGTVSKAVLRRLLRDGAERVWAFPSAMMPS